LQGESFLSETKPFENPLIPNKKLRQLFVAMVEMRVLDEHVARVQRGVKARRRMVSTRGEEACRVSLGIELVAGDLVSDAAVGVAMGLVAGEKVGALLRQVAASGSSVTAAGRQVPWIEDVGDRLRMAMGAALAFKTLKQVNVVEAFVRAGEVSNGTWRRVLALASKLELPIIFVVLQEGAEKKTKRKAAGVLSALARSCGVPGIPVDASDAVALYRVAQESLGRMRGGDGPVLVECVALAVKGRRGVVDPLVQMREFLLGRKVCSEAWLDRAGEALTGQIVAATGRARAGMKLGGELTTPFRRMASKLEE
jgi:TPP-dependent pyruvate/acetoin dehydrogenase alpha subunit